MLSSYVQTQIWYARKKTWLTKLLLPFTWIYRSLCFVRAIIQKNMARAWKKRPVIIVVGNLSVGGTGKTPMVCTLVKHLCARGLSVGVISHGFKAKFKKVVPVFPYSDPTQVGDEAVLVARKTDVPVCVARSKKEGVRFLAKRYHIDVVVTDDGLTHYSMPRDIEIAMVDNQRGFGNEQCLPAGPLRESIQRLKSVNWVLIRHLNYVELMPKSLEQKLAPYKNKTHAMLIRPMDLMSLHDNSVRYGLHAFPFRAIHAVAGIANPKQFFSLLNDLGFVVIEHAFEDHHNFTEEDLHFNSELPIVMTEKDAIKCKNFTHENIWVLKTQCVISKEFSEEVIQRVNTLKEKGRRYG